MIIRRQNGIFYTNKHTKSILPVCGNFTSRTKGKYRTGRIQKLSQNGASII